MRLSQWFSVLLAMTVGLAVISVYHVSSAPQISQPVDHSSVHSFKSVHSKPLSITQSVKISRVADNLNNLAELSNTNNSNQRNSIQLPKNQSQLAITQTSLSNCDFSYFTGSEPEKLYRVHAELVNQPIPNSNNQSNVHVKATITFNCLLQHHTDQSTNKLNVQTIPRASFRVHSTGASFSALPPSQTLFNRLSSGSVEHQSIDRLVVRLPLYDLGNHLIHVKLMSWHSVDQSISPSVDDWLTADFTWQQQLNETETKTRWVDRSIIGSPLEFSIDSFKQSHSHLINQPASYQCLFDPPPVETPLCFSSGSHSQLSGRWFLGPEISKTLSPASHSSDQSNDDDKTLNHFDPVYVPDSCSFDYSIELIDQLRQHKWLHLVGDSNTRYLFMHLCNYFDGNHFEAIDQNIRDWDSPHLCIINPSSDRSISQQVVITYTHWHWSMKLPFSDDFSFASQCAKFTENCDVLWSNKEFKNRGWPTQSGWPNCSLAAEHIQSLKGPGLTYFGWTSHAAERGATARMKLFFMHELLNQNYFTIHPTLIGLTPEVDSSLIPDKFGAQYIYRNNERIEAVNSLLRQYVFGRLNDWPVDMVDQSNKQSNKQSIVPGFIPIYDLFTVTHAISELSHIDAVHFVEAIYHQTMRVITHFMHHAPQLKSNLKRRAKSGT